jgi:hypothetical protein
MEDKYLFHKVLDKTEKLRHWYCFCSVICRNKSTDLLTDVSRIYTTIYFRPLQFDRSADFFFSSHRRLEQREVRIQPLWARHAAARVANAPRQAERRPLHAPGAPRLPLGPHPPPTRHQQHGRPYADPALLPAHDGGPLWVG